MLKTQKDRDETDMNLSIVILIPCKTDHEPLRFVFAVDWPEGLQQNLGVKAG